MNILVVCNYDLYRNLTSSFVHAQIREYVKLGHRVRVIIPAAMGKEARNDKRIDKLLSIWQADGAQLCDLRYPSLGKYGRKKFNVASALTTVRLQLNRIVKDFQPDVIHAHTFGLDSEMGAMLKDQLGCPLVVTTHGSDTFVPYTQGKFDELKHFADAADEVVCVSSLLRKRLEECGVSSRMSVILNGFNIRYKAGSVPKDPMHMIQVGNLIPRKKTDVTIQAVEKLKKEFDGIQLTVIGSGEEREKLELLCEQMGLTDSVTFTGQLPNQQVHAKLAEASVFVMPSVREGFGIVYLEAMAAGCVVIGTEGEGIADLVEHGVNGYLVPADDPDAIVRVVKACINDPEGTAKVAKNGQEAALNLTWTRNALQYEKLFLRLLEELGA